MKISIASRSRPFSHQFGTTCAVPGSEFCAEIYPTMVKIFQNDKEYRLIGTLEANLEGPISNFCVTLDLEKNRISVWGDSSKGYFRYHLSYLPQEKLINLFVEKSSGNLEWNNSFPISFKKTFSSNLTAKRLFLEVNKQQEWDLVLKRQDLREIFPHLLRLSEINGNSTFIPMESHSSLLGKCHLTLAKKDKMSILPSIRDLINASNRGIMAFLTKDHLFQGFNQPICPDEMAGFQLLGQIGQIIEKIFYSVEGNQIFILPLLPPEFHAGRFCDIPLEKEGVLHFEWTKKKIRRMMLHTAHPQTINFNFGKDVKKFRLRVAENDRGKLIMANSSLDFEGGVNYLIDRFE